MNPVRKLGSILERVWACFRARGALFWVGVILLWAQSGVVLMCSWFSSVAQPELSLYGVELATVEGWMKMILRLAAGDVAFYVAISEEGYGADMRLQAFFPGWPFVIRLVSEMFDLDPFIVAFVLANVFKFLAFWVASLGDEMEVIQTDRILAFLIIAFSPAGFFLSVGYSESLCLFCICCFMWALDSRKECIAAILAVCVIFVRPIGVFLMGFLVFVGLKKRGEKFWVAIAIAFLGYGLFLLFALVAFDDVFGFFRAQEVFPAKNSVSRGVNVFAGLLALFEIEAFHSMFGSLIDRWVFVKLCVCVVIAQRAKSLWWLYGLGAGIFVAFATGYVAFSRYFLMLFPVIVVAMPVLRRYLGFVGIAVVAVPWICVQLFLLWRFVNFRWAG